MRLRTLLIAAVIAALAIPAATVARTSKGHDHGGGKGHGTAGLVGTWDVTVTPGDNTPPFPALLTFDRGGGLTETESDAPGTGLGAWKRTGGNTFALSFKNFAFNAAGEPQGWVVVRSTVTLSDGKLSGPFAFDVFDPTGKKVASGNGTATATRFVIAPL
jgi:hypothetical protein